MDDLAERSHVSRSTIKDYESGGRNPIQNNLEALRRALEAEGMIFVAMPNGDLGISHKTRGTSPRAGVVAETPKTKRGGKTKA
jgi:transcriptional regulator with XRE-family HTH domain